jgi:hypothetical protein
MTVAIIGSGKMGSGFARLLASKGIDVAVGNKNPDKAVALAKEIGAQVKGAVCGMLSAKLTSSCLR